jgi:hypothetical protein
MPLAVFGPGVLIVTRTDLTTPQTPVNIGYAQELTLDAAGETKQLYGQDQLPLVTARSTIKATGKIKAAMIQPLAYNTCFWGQSSTVGGRSWNIGESKTVPTGGGTVTVSNGATFDADLGAVYASNQVPFQRVTVAPTIGTYSVNTTNGQYAFASADQSLGVNITYTNTIATGSTLAIVNQPIGFTPTFQLDYWTQLNQPQALPFSVRVYYCVADKLMMQFKLTDFMMPEFDFTYAALQSGKVVDYVYPANS